MTDEQVIQMILGVVIWVAVNIAPYVLGALAAIILLSLFQRPLAWLFEGTVFKFDPARRLVLTISLCGTLIAAYTGEFFWATILAIILPFYWWATRPARVPSADDPASSPRCEELDPAARKALEEEAERSLRETLRR